MKNNDKYMRTIKLKKYDKIVKNNAVNQSLLELLLLPLFLPWLHFLQGTFFL
jgi:hypothetical protein